MKRETLSFAVFFLAMALLFRMDCGNWRAYQVDYRRSATERQQERWFDLAGPRGDAPSPDSVLALIERENIDSRLSALADSLAAVREQIGGYERMLMAARDALRDGGAGAEEIDAGEYFSAVRSFRRLNGEADALEEAVDSLRGGIDATALMAAGEPEETIAEIRWVSPERVPVREACTTCHLPVDGGERVLLYPDTAETIEYPQVMRQHHYAEFGCTVCHAGSPRAVSFDEAHGPDRHLRPFRPGKLALRSCGMCHADRTPLVSENIEFTWPEACADCHGGISPAALADSADTPLLRVPIGDIDLRNWLLRHWAEKRGVVPTREEFEEALAMLVSGDVRKMAVREFLADEAGTGTAAPADSIGPGRATCPECGRVYRLPAGMDAVFCPADGSRLVRPGSRP